MDQRDIVIRTIIGEAAGESPEGWAAVAHVLRNRASDSRWPDQVGAVALQPQQFSAWNEGAGGNSLVRDYSPDDAIYQRIGQVVDAVFEGQISDNTGGATHYYSPAGMDKLVNDGSQSNSIPRWMQAETDRRGGGTTAIGGHIFTGLREGGTPQQGIPQSPVSMPQGGQPQAAPQGFTQEQIETALAEAAPKAQAAPQASAQRAAPQMAPVTMGQGYQRDTDSLKQAMQAFASLQQQRKGLLG